MTEKSGADSRSTTIRGFFAIDRRAWARVCALGLNPAVAYLVLACGTGGDNRTTRWSDQAVRKYTDLTRVRTDKAMATLLVSGLVRLEVGGSRPQFYIMPAHEVPGCDDARTAEPDWIWLPNTIVMGAAGETPPVCLLRQAQDPAALRPFVDLYHSHGLAEDGGVHWRCIRQGYTRHKIGERGPFVVWGFEAATVEAWATAPFIAPHLTGQYEQVVGAGGSKKKQDTGLKIFWGAWGLLDRLGLLELVGHVIEADNDTAEIVHPCAIANGEVVERDIRIAAQTLAETLLTPAQLERAQDRDLHLLPARKGQPNVQLVGIARLRYRPHTTATAAWHAKAKEWAAWRERYQELAENAAVDDRWADWKDQHRESC